MLKALQINLGDEYLLQIRSYDNTRYRTLLDGIHVEFKGQNVTLTKAQLDGLEKYTESSVLVGYTNESGETVSCEKFTNLLKPFEPTGTIEDSDGDEVHVWADIESEIRWKHIMKNHKPVYNRIGKWIPVECTTSHFITDTKEKFITSNSVNLTGSTLSESGLCTLDLLPAIQERLDEIIEGFAKIGLKITVKNDHRDCMTFLQIDGHYVKGLPNDGKYGKRVGKLAELVAFRDEQLAYFEKVVSTQISMRYVSASPQFVAQLKTSLGYIISDARKLDVFKKSEGDKRSLLTKLVNLESEVDKFINQEKMNVN